MAKNQKIRKKTLRERKELVSLIVMLIMLVLLVGTISAVSQSINVNVVETQKLDITFIPIDSPSNFNSNIEEFVKFFNATYPLADNGLIINVGSDYSTSDKEKSSSNWLLFDIAKKFSILPGKKIRVVGVLPEDWFSDFQNSSSIGKALRPPTGSTFWRSALVEAVDIRYAAAHEIGHTLELCDEYYSVDWETQNNIPFVPCPNGDSDNNDELDPNCEPYGCPTSTIGKLVPWNESSDFINMTNFMGDNLDDKIWISEESYNHLLEKFKKSSSTLQKVIIVNGFINKATNSVELFTSYIIEDIEVTTQEENVTGNYSIMIMDDNNLTTSKINFIPSFLEIGLNGSTIETNESFFIFTMNFSDADKIIRIIENNITKDELNRTLNTPSINITSNLSGQTFTKELFNMTWNSFDADNDTSVYAILFSNDGGGNYTTLEIDYEQTFLEINSSNLQDCVDCKIKILVTDGINTNSSISDTFSIENTPQNKFLVKDSLGNNVAFFSDIGNIVLKGNCFSNSSCDNSGLDSFIIRNLNNSNVAFVNSTGDLCIDSYRFNKWKFMFNRKIV